MWHWQLAASERPSPAVFSFSPVLSIGSSDGGSSAPALLHLVDETSGNCTGGNPTYSRRISFFWSFEFQAFEFVSDFEIRISDFFALGSPTSSRPRISSLTTPRPLGGVGSLDFPKLALAPVVEPPTRARVRVPRQTRWPRDAMRNIQRYPYPSE